MFTLMSTNSIVSMHTLGTDIPKIKQAIVIICTQKKPKWNSLNTYNHKKIGSKNNTIEERNQKLIFYGKDDKNKYEAFIHHICRTKKDNAKEKNIKYINKRIKIEKNRFRCPIKIFMFIINTDDYKSYKNIIREKLPTDIISGIKKMLANHTQFEHYTEFEKINASFSLNNYDLDISKEKYLTKKIIDILNKENRSLQDYLFFAKATQNKELFKGIINSFYVFYYIKKIESFPVELVAEIASFIDFSDIKAFAGKKICFKKKKKIYTPLCSIM